MAEALLRHHLAQAGVDATVASAGLHPGGRPATDHGIAAMADRGLDLADHRSRQVDADLVRGAELIVAMAREHVREVAVLDQEAVRRTFTLKELVRAAEAKGRRSPDEALATWLARLAEGRRREDLLGVGHDPAFDVDDPIGRDRADYETTASELDDLLRRLVELGWPVTADQERRT
jgi:protein-tyrosine phosphatase